jgi:hypothetical protein
MKLSIAGLKSNKQWIQANENRGISCIVAGSTSSRFKGCMDLAPHADTCITGRVFHINSTTRQKCMVIPYWDKYKPSTAFNNPVTGIIFILDVFQV